MNIIHFYIITSKKLLTVAVGSVKAAFLWRSCLKLMLSIGYMVLLSVTKTNISNRPLNRKMRPFKAGQFTFKGDGTSILQLNITGATNSKLLVPSSNCDYTFMLNPPFSGDALHQHRPAENPRFLLGCTHRPPKARNCYFLCALVCKLTWLADSLTIQTPKFNGIASR